MSPDTQPTASAVRLIESIATDIADALDSSVDKPPFTTEAQLMREWAQRVDAFVAERIEEATDGDRTFARLAQVERERDAALAKLEATDYSLRAQTRSHAATIREWEAAEAELAGLREIATSGPSTASGPSLLSHPVTWCAAWDNERAAICGRNRPCSVHGAAAPMEDAP